MAAEEDFVLSFTGEETDNLLKHTESMKNQTTEEDGETVQVYDTNGVPHKVSKTELLKKSTLALPALEDISSFVAVNAAGNAVGVMTKEQVASVLAELYPTFLYRSVARSLWPDCAVSGCEAERVFLLYQAYRSTYRRISARCGMLFPCLST